MAAHNLICLGDLKQNPSEKEIDKELCTILVREIAGPDEATDESIDGAGGIVYIYNAGSKLSFCHITAIHDKLQKIKSASTPSLLVGIVLVGTEQEVFFKDGDELARKWGCNFSVETDATVG
ncbi:hypothetical protein B0O99DRAFT_394223 [Bisporella sp. PMI_857]|nr:hypothetical protein B0O99DRAFT_394223 [Bisporella sp. PMI_857]